MILKLDTKILFHYGILDFYINLMRTETISVLFATLYYLFLFYKQTKKPKAACIFRFYVSVKMVMAQRKSIESVKC